MNLPCRVSVFLLAGLLAAAALPAQNYAPPPAKSPDAATLKVIADKTAQLGKAISSLRRQGVRDPGLADVEVYHKAAVWIVRHNEFFTKDAATWTLEALDRGLLRARFLGMGEFPWLQPAAYSVARAYRSRIDDSVQPYAITFPAKYGADLSRRWRLDVVLHGRESSLTEVQFLHQHNGDRAASKEDQFVKLDIYGRGNNAYRWAGEADVYEAIEAFVATERQLGRDKLLDLARVVLRGFSMGGAGTWHIGLHTPSRWCVIGPGAGFTATHGYINDLPDPLPPWQEACLRIYDAVDYAENAADVPVVAYDGSKDPQLQAARNIEARLKPLGIPMQLLIVPGLGHKPPPPEWQKKVEAAYAPFLAKGREEYPARIHFVTYTLRYPRCDWVEILGLERHYERAVVDAEKTESGFTVKTTNVHSLHLMLPVGAPQALMVNIDGQAVPARPGVTPLGTFHVYLRKQAGQWTAVLPQRLVTDHARHPRKGIDLMGPIDDAFTNSFLCVVGTERPWHEATQKYAAANLQRFRDEWSKYWRGELPVKDDVDVNNDDIATKHLILFGDPASNSLLAHVVDGLPLRWTKERLTVAGKTYASADHVPVLIYPSPLNAARYVVLNSGHTFHANDYRGTNALLYPRLGDYAVLRLAATDTDPLAVEVAAAGLFDEHWQPPQ
jgi:pimeloyl-ACP methyl ester carboxylesterase